MNRSIHRASLLLVGSVLVSRVIGFAREWVLAQTVGATRTTDVYLASFTIPDFLNYLMAAGALSISFIPMLNEYLAAGDHDKAKRIFRALSTVMLGVLTVLIIFAEIFARPLANIVAPGFNAEQLDLLAYLVRIILPAQLFFYWGGLAVSVQHTHGKFLASAMAPIIYNSAIILGGLLLHRSHGIAGFSFGVLGGSLVGHGILQMLAIRKLGYPITPSFHFDLEIRTALKRYFWLTIPIMFGFSLVVTDEWISKYMASQLGDRAISWLSYARTEMRIPIAIIGQVAGIASFPFLARLWSQKNYDGYAKTLLREISKLWALGPLAAILLVNHAVPITHFIYGGGKLTPQDIEATSQALQYMGLGVVFWIMQTVLARGFYACQRTWFPPITGGIISLCCLPLYKALAERMGHKGLALAGSIGIAVYCLVLSGALYRHVRRNSPEYAFRRFYTFVATWSLVLVAMAFASEGVLRLGLYHGTRLSALADVVVAGIVVGGISLLLLRTVFRKLTDGALY